MEKQVHKIAKRFYDAYGLWIGPADYKVTIGGVDYDWRELAKAYNIQPPKTEHDFSEAVKSPKKQKQINIDEEEKSYGDLEQAQDPGSAEEHGDGDSESTK